MVTEEWVEVKGKRTGNKDPRSMVNISKEVKIFVFNTSSKNEIVKKGMVEARFLHTKNGTKIALGKTRPGDIDTFKIVFFRNRAQMTIPKEIKALIIDYRKKNNGETRKFQVEWDEDLNAFVFDLSKGE